MTVTESFNASLKDSGSRRLFETGAQRDNGSGKGRLDLLPADAIIELAKHFEKGGLKYKDRNWEQGIPMSRYVDSALRHTFQFLAGHTDEPHLISAAWNLVCAIQTLRWIEQGVLPTSLDDLPGPRKAYSPCDCGCCSAPKTERVNALTHEQTTQKLFESYEASTESKNDPMSLSANLPTDADKAAVAAYTLTAKQVYGENLVIPFIDEETLDGIVKPTGFTIGNDQQQYWWDGLGSVTWNADVFGSTYQIEKQIKHAAFSVVDAYNRFASGEWAAAPFHSRIILRQYRETKAPEGAVPLTVELAVEDNEEVGHIVSGGKVSSFLPVKSDYTRDEGWTEF